MTFWGRNDSDRVELLKKLWLDGLSASQVASRIGGCSRNAVISKLHRLGLTGRPQDANRGRHGSRRHANGVAARKARAANNNKPIAPGSTAFNAPHVPTVTAEPYESTYVEIDVPIAERKQLIDLEKDDCRWPIGDPTKSDFHFCNGKKIKGLPYCDHHARVAFQPATPSERRRSNAHVEHVAKRETVDA